MLISRMRSYGQRRVAIFFLFVLFLTGAYLFFFKRLVVYQQTRYCLGTAFRIHVVARRFQKKNVFHVFDTAWGRLFEINDRFNLFDDRSDLSAINRSYPSVVRVDPETYDVLKRAVQWSKKTQGAFDPTSRALSLLWSKAEENAQLPSDEEIQDVLKSGGVDQIVFLSDFNVQLLNSQVRVDLNAVIQGYAADEGGRILLEHGFHDFLIDAGGEIYAHGLSARSRPWTVGIKDPQDQERFIDVLQVSDKGVSTSGGYEKFFEIHGHKYSHIIDPKTGYPSDGFLSVTVIAPTAMEADILSTAFSVLDVEGSRLLAESLGGDIGFLIMAADHQQGNKKYFNRCYSSLVMKKQ